jgi:hypothetical protein
VVSGFDYHGPSSVQPRLHLRKLRSFVLCQHFRDFFGLKGGRILDVNGQPRRALWTIAAAMGRLVETVPADEDEDYRVVIAAVVAFVFHGISCSVKPRFQLRQLRVLPVGRAADALARRGSP